MKPCFDRLLGLQVSLIAGCNVKPGDDRRVPIDSLCLALALSAVAVVHVWWWTEKGGPCSRQKHAFSRSGFQTAGSR